MTSETTLAPSRDAETLLRRTLDVYDAALAAHGDELPWSQLIELANQALDGHAIGVAVHADDDPRHLYARFTIRFAGCHFEYTGRGDPGTEYRWRVPKGYLERVAADPVHYAAHPDDLDWDVLRVEQGTYK